MKRRTFLAAAALALLVPSCATPAGPEDQSVYVMRHLHTPEGQRDPDLTEEGQRAASALAERLAGSGIRAIYVSGYKRTGQTAALLASRLGLAPVVYDPAATPALLDLVRAGPRPALIVGHSNTVPDIVEGLGGNRPAPLSHDDFGDVWIVDPDGAVTRFRLAD